MRYDHTPRRKRRQIRTMLWSLALVLGSAASYSYGWMSNHPLPTLTDVQVAAEFDRRFASLVGSNKIQSFDIGVKESLDKLYSHRNEILRHVRHVAQDPRDVPDVMQFNIFAQVADQFGRMEYRYQYSFKFEMRDLTRADFSRLSTSEVFGLARVVDVSAGFAHAMQHTRCATAARDPLEHQLCETSRAL